MTVQGPFPADVVLADGGTVSVRPIEPTDGERLEALHSRLSRDSIYLRFFSPKPRLTEAEVRHFTTVDHVDREALVATLRDEIIAVARYDRWPGRDEAEAAFVVDDAHQGRGITTLLIEHLVALARGREIRRFTAEVLPQNRAMLSVFGAIGFAVTRTLSQGVVDVVMDLEPTDVVIDSIEVRAQRAESRSIARLLSPRSVAVIGAGRRPGTVGHEIVRLLAAHGFPGGVYPVNSSATEVAGLPATSSALDIADDVHLAIVAVPAPSVLAAVQQCAAKGVRGVIVVTEGLDAGQRRRIIESARHHGMRVLGPGSMGLVRVEAGSHLHATFADVEVTAGPVAISSQSGPLGVAMLEQAARLELGVSTFVSLADRGDLSGNDFLQFWYDDPATSVVLGYTETFGNPRKFARIARRVSTRKPIVAVKAPSASGETKVDALYAQAGVLRVGSVAELFDTGRVLATQPLPRGPRTAIITNSLSPALLARAGVDAAGLSSAGIVDLTHTAGPTEYDAGLRNALDRSDVDAVVVIDAPAMPTRNGAVASVIEQVGALLGTHKPVVAVSLGNADGPLVPGGRVPTFAFPEPAVAALGRAWCYEQWRRRDRGLVPELDDFDVDSARAVVEASLSARAAGTLLPLRAVAAVLAAAGVPFAPAHAVTSLGPALAAADALGYPVALKAMGLARPARSESSGIALDLQGRDEVEGAFERMRAALGDRAMAEVVVQRMAPGGVETRVTVTADRDFGPVVGFGLGGAYADAIADRAVRALPLTDVDARELVAASRAAEVIDDTARLVDVLLRIAALADALPELNRIDLNPVLVSSSSVWVVGAAFHVAPADPPDAFPIRKL